MSTQCVAGLLSRRQTHPKKGGPDLAFAQCVKSEQAKNSSVNGRRFLPAEKTNCIGSEAGGLASYTDLVTCHEMARDARQLNQNK
jgi:hypothetical protein